MMPIKLTYDIVEESSTKFVGWLNEIEGVIAQGESKEEVRSELIKVLRIKLEVERKDKASKKHVTNNTHTEELNFQLAEA